MNTENDPPSNRIPEDRLDLRCLRAIRQVIRQVDLQSHQLATLYGVTVPQLLALRALHEKGPMMLKTLAGETYLSSSTMVGIVDRLEAKHLVRRQRSAHDRRQLLIVPTEQAEALIERAPSPLQDALTTALDELPELERTLITLSLERLVSLLDSPLFLDTSPILDTGVELESQPQPTQTEIDSTGAQAPA